MAIPQQIVSSSILSIDYLASNQVLVDTTSATPVSVFRNVARNDVVEALVIASVQGTDSQICYLSQNADATTGWQLTGLTSQWGAITATEMVGFSTPWGTVEAYFIGLDGTLYHLAMDSGGTTWSEPQAAAGAPAGMTQLGVTYPGNSAYLIVTAVTTDGNLYIAANDAGAWQGFSSTGSPFASGVDSLAIDPASGLGTELFWYIQEGILNYASMGGNSVAVVNAMTEIDGGTLLGVVTRDDGAPSVAFAGTSSGIAWATVTYDPGYFLFTDKLPLPAAVRGGTLVQLTSGLVNLYVVDTSDNVWVVPVTGWTTQTFNAIPYDTPVFGQPIQLRTGIGTIHADGMPADTPTLIGADASLGALHLSYQDPSTGDWRSGAMILPSTEQYTLSRWRTEIAVYDTNGQPVPNYPLTVAADSAIDLAVGGQFYYVDSATTATITTNVLGKATVATLATGLTTAQLTVTGADLPGSVTIAPHQGISDYLAGTGTLPGLPPLTAQTLQQATVDGQPLAPALQGTSPSVDPSTVATYLQALAQAPTSTTTARAAAAEKGPRYLVLTRLDPTGPVYQEHATTEALEAQHARVRAAVGTSFWNDVWDFAGDVWEGIKRAAISVYQATLDTVEQTVSLFVKIGEEIYELAAWGVKTLSDALHGIEAVFNWVGAEVDKVIDWLKALFDFSAIWNTKTALETGIAGYLTGMQNGIDAFSNYFGGAGSPIASLKSALDQRFAQAKETFGGQAFSGLSGWQTTGQPPSPSAGPNGAPSPATYSNHVHANWLHDQMATNAPATIDGTSGLQDHTAWNNLVIALGNVTDDLERAFQAFADAFSALFTVSKLSTLGDILITDFLTIINALLDAVLDAADALVQGILALAEVVVGALQDLLTTPVSIGFLNTLYGWIAKWAGVSNPPPLTPGGLFSLLIAFPATVIFKLAVGADQEPFPGGQLPQPGGTMSVPLAGSATPGASPTLAWLGWSSQLIGAIITAVDFIPAVVQDLDDTISWVATWGTVGSILAAVASMAPTMLPEAIDWTEALSSGGATLVAVVGTALLMGAIMFSGLLATAFKWIQSDAAKDPLKIFFSIFGVIMLGYKVFCVIEDYDELRDTQIASDLMSPWGNIMSIAGLSWLKDSELYPFALVLQIVGDFVGSIGSGGTSVDDLLTHQPSLA